MANAWARDRAGLFYFGFGFYALAAVIVGFSTTYLVPVARGSFAAPAVVHLHGAVALSWVVFFFAQTALVRNNQSRLHRQLGQAGIPIALGILISGMGTALWATKRDLAAESPMALTIPVGNLTSFSIFTGYVVFGVAMRRRPDWHKRLMMLATVVVLWPAFFRFRHLMPWVPRPDIWLALVLADFPYIRRRRSRQAGLRTRAPGVGDLRNIPDRRTNLGDDDLRNEPVAGPGRPYLQGAVLAEPHI